MTRAEVAADLMRWHFTVEPELTKILWVGPNEPDTAPLRFLEVASERGDMERGIEVFAFDATTDVPFPSEVAEVTEQELTLIVAGVLSLPLGWGLDGARAFTREALGIALQETATP
jgi:hypothetical protein